MDLSTTTTEAELEAAARGVLLRAFPWLAQRDVRLQTSFTIRLGTVEHQISARLWLARGRADVLVWADGRPLAVIELKRPGIALDGEDSQQAFSYAQLTRPPAPLVVVSSGESTQVYATYNRGPLGASLDESRLTQALEGVMLIAAGDLREAVSTLLRGRFDWAQVVEAVSRSAIVEQSGPVTDLLAPFSEFRLPRSATDEVLSHIRADVRAIAVTGPPLAGKSNVLRDVIERTVDSNDIAVLYVEGDHGGNGLFQQVANLLRARLQWNATKDDVRAWLHARSWSSEDRKLVLAIDGVGDAVRSDVEELLTGEFGTRLVVLFALDDASIGSFLTNSAGTKKRPFARWGRIVQVRDLSGNEAPAAFETLRKHQRIEFMLGARYARELRMLRVLRTMVAGVVSEPGYEGARVAILPPMLGTQLFEYLRRSVPGAEVRLALRSLASALIAEAGAPSSAALALSRRSSFATSRKYAAEHVPKEELALLVETGYLRRGVIGRDEPVYICRVPERVAAEMAVVFEERLLAAADPAVTLRALVASSAQFQFGDVAVAESILGFARECGSAPYALINTLLVDAPASTAPAAGTRAALELDGVLVDVRFGHGTVTYRALGHEITVAVEDDTTLIARTESWIILSHLARVPLVGLTGDDAAPSVRIDGEVLLKIGQCPFLLRRVDEGTAEDIPMHEHDGVSVPCGDAGILEPVGVAILDFLDRAEHSEADAWIAKARETDSIPLLNRIHTALLALSAVSSGRRAWLKSRMESIADHIADLAR